MIRESSYDKNPVIAINNSKEDCLQGWPEILARIEREIAPGPRRTVTIECYPGVFIQDLAQTLRARFGGALIVDASAAYKSSAELALQFASKLTDDPVFGRMYPWTIADFFDHTLLERQRHVLEDAPGLSFIIGAGAALLHPHPSLLVHAGVTRWELQHRQRAHRIGNLGLENSQETPGRLYKNAFFVDWRVADRLRHEIYNNVDFFLDLNSQEDPRMLSGEVLRDTVAQAVHRPFRVVPFFDPGPWGGDWMRQEFDLPDGPSNYAWGFDCVPEENSVVFGFGNRGFELPANVLVHEKPEDLLGDRIHRRFGAEFPIRFDLLDTMDGGNLSLQVHPMKEYIREHFGMDYTQDESYYILDRGENSELYLGLREGVVEAEMCRTLKDAQQSDRPFQVERFVNIWPTRKHDHFPIPAGTIHCSGRNNVVLEISATPYIFTFKLWDWGRLGLDGRPRPIHLEHGLKNIQWNRTTEWVRNELIDQVQEVGRGKGWYEERTGLHASEFLETRRHWFTDAVLHHTDGNLNVLNLVEGEAVVVESPTGAFPPTPVHYAETFIVPASVGEYRVRPVVPPKTPLATIKAYVRDLSSSKRSEDKRTSLDSQHIDP